MKVLMDLKRDKNIMICVKKSKKVVERIMYMKLYRVVGSVGFLIIILLIFFTKCKQNSYLNADAVNNNVESGEITSESRDVKSIMQNIDLQVKKIKNRINFNFNKEYYDGDIPVFRHFENGMEQEMFTQYYLYYNEQGKLIYAEITHYRGALYSIYYHKDELLHVEVGSFSYEGDLSINGDIADVETVIKKDSDYAFILEDNSLCLRNAYSPSRR